MKRNVHIEIKPGGRVFEYIYDSAEEAMWSNPLPTEEEINEWYGSQFDYGWYNKRRFLKNIQAQHRWTVIRKYLKKFEVGTKILDIGCGHGLFLDYAKKEGFNTYGSDFKSPASQAAKDKKHKILEGPFLNINFGYEKFKVVTMWHSLEHFIYPEEALKKIKSLLDENGILIIAVPNLSCKGVELKDVGWVWIQQPFVHIWHWGPKSLPKLIEKIGFISKEIMTRDTWDANFIYDGYLMYWYENLIYKIGSSLDKPINKIFNRKISVFEDYICFVFAELTRIFCYILTKLIETFRINKLIGSELIVIGALSAE